MTDVKSLNVEFEQALKLLAQSTPPPETLRKPLLFHGIRASVFLYEHGYTREIVLAALLHDALEFTTLTAETIEETFGEHVLRLVRASTKDDSISDPVEKTRELISRCIANGQDALVVKTADVLDSFKYYTATSNADQLKYCLRNANTILDLKPTAFSDPIFDQLCEWRDRTLSQRN